MSRKYNIVQIGTFDVENYGDLLFTDILVKEFNKRIEVNKYFFLSPNECKMPFYGIQVHKLRELENILQTEKIDLIVIGGGDLVRLDRAIAPGYQKMYKVAVELWQTPIVLANQYNVPIAFNALGVPFDFTLEQQETTKQLLDNVAYLSVRDDYSNAILKQAGIENATVVPDTVNIIAQDYGMEELRVRHAKLKETKVFPNIEKYIVIQHYTAGFLQNEEYLIQLREFIKHVSDDCEVVLMPIGYVHSDIAIMERVYDETNKRVHLLTEKYHPVDMVSIVANAAGYIGTSLHGTITSHAYGVPVLCINTCQLVKVDGYMRHVNKDNLVLHTLDNAKQVYDNAFKKQTFEMLSSVERAVSNHFDVMVDILKTKNMSNQNLSNLQYTSQLCTIYEYGEDRAMRLALEKEKEKLILEKDELVKQNLQLTEESTYYKVNYNDIINRKYYKLFSKFDRLIQKVKK